MHAALRKSGRRTLVGWPRRETAQTEQARELYGLVQDRLFAPPGVVALGQHNVLVQVQTADPALVFKQAPDFPAARGGVVGGHAPPIFAEKSDTPARRYRQALGRVRQRQAFVLALDAHQPQFSGFEFAGYIVQAKFELGRGLDRHAAEFENGGGESHTRRGITNR